MDKIMIIRGDIMFVLRNECEKVPNIKYVAFKFVATYLVNIFFTIF